MIITQKTRCVDKKAHIAHTSHVHTSHQNSVTLSIVCVSYYEPKKIDIVVDHCKAAIYAIVNAIQQYVSDTYVGTV